MTDHHSWEADVILNDGGIATLRPVTDADRDALHAFYARVSDRSKYLRFFGTHPELTDEDLQHWLDTDGRDNVTLVVVERNDIVGVATFKLLPHLAPARVADVAFLVQDSHQGRGVGNIMLEHLTEIGRECDIDRFVAEMLPNNRQMVQTFVRAGYSAKPELADGFISVDFTIAASRTSREVMERREQRAEANSLRRLIRPHSVAVVGPIDGVRPIVPSLATSDFAGDIRIVTAKDDGQAIAEVIDQIGADIDVVIIPQTANLSESLDAVLAASARRQAFGVVVLANNLSPTISRDHARQLVETARDHGLRALGPAALGLINTDPEVRLNAAPAPMPRQGSVGLFTQSAGVAMVMLTNAMQHGLGLSSFIAAGGFADVTGNDVIQYWSTDEQTDICLLSLDTIGNPRKFFRVLRRLALVKHVIVFLPSRALASARYTDAAGAELVSAAPQALDAVIEGTGAMVVSRRETMFNVARMLARQPVPQGPRVAVLSNSTGLAAQMEQSALRFGLSPTPMLITGSPVEGITEAVRSARAADVDAVLVTVVEAGEPMLAEAVTVLTELAADGDIPLAASLVGFAAPDPVDSAPEQQGQLALFANYADALEAFAKIVATERTRAAIRTQPDDDPAPSGATEALAVVERILATDPAGRWATDAETNAILGAYGIEVSPSAEVSGTSLTIGSTEDPTMGPMVSVGISGVPSQVLGDVSYAVPPLRRNDVRRMLEQLRSATILQGYRAMSAARMDTIEDVLLRLACLADDIPSVVEVELHPVIASAQATHIFGARLRVAPLNPHRDPRARRIT